jgi:hypothetical protein
MISLEKFSTTPQSRQARTLELLADVLAAYEVDAELAGALPGRIWAQVAAKAGTRVPNEATRSAVIAMLRERSDQPWKQTYQRWRMARGASA